MRSPQGPPRVGEPQVGAARRRRGAGWLTTHGVGRPTTPAGGAPFLLPVWDHLGPMPVEPSRTPKEEPAHDVLAAEAFAVPAPDPNLRHRPVVLPEDPSGIAEPHDILAAEEFAMPAVKQESSQGALARSRGLLARGAESPWRAALGAAGALLAVAGLRRHGRR